MKPEVTILTDGTNSITIDGIVYERKDISVYTEDQIPEPEETWLNGSHVLIMSTRDVKFLYKGEWI